MLLFRQIAHAMANLLPARKLNDRAVPFSHVVRRYEDPAPLGAKGGALGTLASLFRPEELRLTTHGRARSFCATPAARCPGDLLPPSPPAENTAAQDQAGQSGTGDGGGNHRSDTRYHTFFWRTPASRRDKCSLRVDAVEVLLRLAGLMT
jgi:hypothetical protein